MSDAIRLSPYVRLTMDDIFACNIPRKVDNDN